MDSHINKTLFIVCGSFLALLGASTTDARVCVHGHSGVLENPYPESLYGWSIPRGYGLEYWVSVTPSWVHYSIPTNADAKTYSKIRIRYSRQECAEIEKITVYSAERKVRFFEANVDYYNIAAHNINYLHLDFDQPERFWNGIGVSIDPIYWWDQCYDNKITIHSVCAFE